MHNALEKSELRDGSERESERLRARERERD